MRTSHWPVWLLIGAVAVAAMVGSHAFEIWLENLGVLGDARASYAHPTQIFAIEAALAVFVIALTLITAGFVRRALRANEKNDNLMPALDGILRLGLARTSVALVCTQLGALVAVELFEQHLAGFRGGVWAIVGPGHVTAIVVHIAVGLIMAFALYRVSRFVSACSRVVGCAIAIFLRRAWSERNVAMAAACLPYRLLASSRKPPLLALGLANRPPPATSTIAA